jgi:hypothetical protein
MKFIGGVFKIALGIIGAIIIIGIIIAIAAGGGSSSSTATTTAPPDSVAPAGTTDTTPAQPAAASGATTDSFSGNGGKRLGTIVVAGDSTIHWTNDSGLFAVLDRDAGIGISSQAPAGTSDLPAGTYHDVQILAVGNWTFRVVAK